MADPITPEKLREPKCPPTDWARPPRVSVAGATMLDPTSNLPLNLEGFVVVGRELYIDPAKEG